MNRGERRQRKIRKWKTRLKNLFAVHSRTYLKIKTSDRNLRHGDVAESYRDLEESKFGVMLKNTGTLFKDNKFLDIQEERRRNLDNRKVSDAEIEDALLEINNKEYCHSCLYFPGDESFPAGFYSVNDPYACPYMRMFRCKKYNGMTKHQEINCEYYEN